MGTSSSRNFEPCQHTFISKHSREVTGCRPPDMATTMDAQISQQDDLGHDTLMGFQELDSHLAIFESTENARDSSTPDTISTPGFDPTIDTIESQPAFETFEHTIIVDSSIGHFQPDVKSRARVIKNLKPSTDVNKKAAGQSKYASDGNIILKPESARDSLASSMTTDHDDGTSSLSSLSSHPNSPAYVDKHFGEVTKISSLDENRQKYNVRPKESIPTDIHPAEYARQCIAAAESSRLSPYTLHPEEYHLLRRHISHQQVTTYLNIRNGILRLWTRNPSIHVMRDEAIGCARDVRWFEAARICHEWLARRGYINYGCLENPESKIDKSEMRSTGRNRRTIAVIGAGMSGLGCARQLESLFAQFEDRFHEMGEELPHVVIIEGRDRVGGRVYSRQYESRPEYPTLIPGSRYTAEMGGMIITGFDRGNPLNVIVRGQLALPYHPLKPDTTIYDDGRPVDLERDQHAEKLFNYILDRVGEYKFKIPPPPLIDGDRDHLDAGRDGNGDGSRTISEVENRASFATQSVASEKSSTLEQMVPVASDRLTGRAHLEPGIPAVHTAAYKAREIGWKLRDGVGIEFDLDLERPTSKENATLGSVFDDAIRQYMRMIDFTPLDLRLINWHVANLEYSNAITCNKLSLGGWDLDAGNEWEGKHTMVTGGYQQVPRGLLNFPRLLDVKKRSAVERIVYNPHPTIASSRIDCENGESIEADYIVSTIPLGVLKQNKIEFEPELPSWKTGAIQRIGYGILNKIILVYKEPFWDEGRDIFGTLRNPPNKFSLDQGEYFTHRGRFFQWFNCTKTSGMPTLLALMAGDAAFHTEKTSNEELICEATRVLRGVFGDHIPMPVESIVTRWGKDQFSRGSYSYTGPNFQSDDYGVMAKPIGNLFFGGEHTCGTHPATVHGAYISGLRAASEVLESIIGPIEVPENFIPPKESASKRKAEAIEVPKDPKQARLEAYESEIWNAIYAKLGDRPWKPAKNHSNSYQMYSKDTWEEAKRKCEEGRRPGKGKPITNEVKKMITKMWNEAPENVKKPYVDRAFERKRIYQEAVADYNVKSAKWDKDAWDFRVQYEKDNPSLPGPDEDIGSPWRRDRKAKRNASGYAEDSGSELDL
ncbi:63333da9-16e2-43e3-bf03-b0f0b507a7aa [Sclerotinia trifoliorum]|uniref:63333da9-16e2-43e3-bf03-b0f0b507a7aa n=1 Tax=Sclerotinia trifoliorum TaxID=28548 RepID=A0A8H2ZXZ1_9HELO|nr:63333da9-16e2-43e3-bf03-b0f0b507a7aa [Sclerotinia trifoliorum]